MYLHSTCVVGLLHLALALQDGVVVAPGKVDVGVVHSRALRHRPAPHLLQPFDVQGVHVVDRRVGIVSAQLRVELGASTKEFLWRRLILVGEFFFHLIDC